MSTKNVLQVMEEMGEIVGLIIRARLWCTVEQIVYNQVPQIQERIVKSYGRSGPNHPKSRCASGIVMPSADHPDSGGSTRCSSLIE